MLNESEFTGLRCTRPGCGAEAVVVDDGTGIFVMCIECTNRYLLHEYPEENICQMCGDELNEIKDKKPLTTTN